MKTKTVKKRHINFAKVLVLILVVYIIICFGIYIYNEPVHHYEIIGNNYIKDVDILRSLGLETYPSYVSVNTKKMAKKLESNSFIKSAKVSYGLNFTIKIEVEENKPMFIVKESNEVCLSDGTLVANTGSFIGVPTLLNNTPTENMKTLASNLSMIDEGILNLINDIEYRPSYNSQNKVIDENRFLLSMNDKNLVYINSKNAKVLNSYLEIIAANKLTSTGTFYMDGERSIVKLFSTTTTTKKGDTTTTTKSTTTKSTSTKSTTTSRRT